MTGRNILLLTSAATLVCGCIYLLVAAVAQQESDAESRKGTFALVRPATPHDADLLLSSFELWEDNLFPPCNSENDLTDIDLIISFSRMTEETIKVADKIRHESKRTNRWNGCFQKVILLDADIPQEDDKYDSELQDIDSNWVNGPNTQFRSIFTDVQEMGYDAFFLMESDTFPRARGWLKSLQDEIEASRPFGILGSKYKGNVWDKNKDTLPVALADHMNGNAIYNVSDPFLNKIVEELEKEKDTLYNAVSYDYRISQIYTEASKDIPSTFPLPRLVASSSRGLPSKMELFQHEWKEFGSDDFIKESSILANYGVVRDEVEEINGDYMLVHGRQYNPLMNQDATKFTMEQRRLRRNTLLLKTVFDEELSDAQFHRGTYGT